MIGHPITVTGSKTVTPFYARELPELSWALLIKLS